MNRPAQLSQHTVNSAPGWTADVVWWHVYPLGFLGAVGESNPAVGPAPRLRALEPWLDYLCDLGCNGLALGPIFASSTHGYDTVDYFAVDPRLGDEEDFAWLVAACRRRGIRILLDGVFNHVGRDFFAFRDVLERGRASEYADWFRIDWDADGPDGFDYADFEGHRQLVALNHAHPAVAAYVESVLGHWLDRGADGWRLDAAYAVPLAFWRNVSTRVRASHPEAWLMGEVIHGDLASFAVDGGLDAVTQYELWKSIWSSLNDRNFFELAWTLDRHTALLASMRPLTFVGNHDVTRIASKVEDPRALALAFVTALTVPGVPSIYAGDEQAFHGIKEDRAGGDDAVRPAFPADPGELAPYGWATYRLHQELIGLRRRNRWISDAQVQVSHLTNERIAYRVTDGRNRIDVLLSVAEGHYRFPGELAPTVSAGSESARRDAPGEIDGVGWAILG